MWEAGACVTRRGWGELRHRVPFFPPAVMKFMGDHPPRGQTELDIVCALLKVIPVPRGWWQRGRPWPRSEPCLSPSCARSTRRCGTRCTARLSSSSPTTPAPSRESCWARTAQPGWFRGQFSTLTPRGTPRDLGSPAPSRAGLVPRACGCCFSCPLALPRGLSSHFSLQGQLPEGLEAALHPHRLLQVLRGAQALPPGFPAGCQRAPGAPFPW